MVARVPSAPSGVTPANWKSHSKSCRGSPVQAQIRCFTSTWRVVALSPRRKEGSSEVTGVVQVILPWSTRRASSSVVIALVLDAIMKRVSASTGSGRPSSRTP